MIDIDSFRPFVFSYLFRFKYFFQAVDGLPVYIGSLAFGCFWSPQDFFSRIKGVTKTVVGYSGGDKPNPTYHHLGNHTETIEITFDPKKVSYEKLLTHFFSQHDTTATRPRQYKSIIFYHDEEQKELAEQALAFHPEAKTKIRKALTFYPAEEYHQHYHEKQRRHPLRHLVKQFGI